MKLTTGLVLVPRLRMHGAIPPLLHMSVRHDAYLSTRDNSTIAFASEI
jgi:hypothetical protein